MYFYFSVVSANLQKAENGTLVSEMKNKSLIIVYLVLLELRYCLKNFYY